jgi:transposase-like protein
MIDYYLEEISKAGLDKDADAIGQRGGGKLFQTARAAGQWTVPMKLQAVMDIIAGQRTIEQVAVEANVETATVETWLKNGKRGMRNGLRARPLTMEEQYQAQIDRLEKRVQALEEENARLLANATDACGQAVAPLGQGIPSAAPG